jgi:hypothetical protein
MKEAAPQVKCQTPQHNIQDISLDQCTLYCEIHMRSDTDGAAPSISTNTLSPHTASA